MDVLRARKEFYWSFPHDTVRRATAVEHGLKDLTLIPSFRRPSQIRPDNQLKTTPELLERIRSSM